MPIGTSDGDFYEDHFDYSVRRPVINPDTDPRFMTHDQNIVTPNEMGTNQQMDQAEQDPTTGTGIPIGLKRVPITGGTYDTPLAPDEETQFQEWKAKNAPKDSGFDYDLRGAFKAGVEPDEKTGHWPDTFKKPNHPTFSDQSQYAKDRPDLAGRWQGDEYIPPGDIDWSKMNQPFGTIKGTAPEDTPIVYKGKNITIREGEIAQAINVGLGAGPGTMMGIKSRALSKPMLQKAQQMAADGVHPDDIWAQTGTFKGADGRWRQEISDAKAVAMPVKDLAGKSLEDVLDHPELFKAYPDLRHIEIQPFEPGQYGRASYNSVNDTIQLGKNFKADDILHEVQHAIQKREGFSPGGSPAEQFALRFEEEVRIAKIEAQTLLEYRKSDAFKGWTKEDEARIQELKRLFEVEALRKGLAAAEAESHYMRLAGEVEARNVELRSILSPEAAKAIAPIWTEDTSRALQHLTDRPMYTTPYGPTLRPDIAPNY